MNYTASITDFFRSQKWGTSLLLGAVCILIPMVGPIVLSGWALTQLWGRGPSSDPQGAPPFDFQHFSKYLMRGLWPFLVQLVASVVIIPVIMVVMFAGMGIVAAGASAGSDSQAAGIVAPLLMIVFMALYISLIIGFNALMTPLTLRASLLQDFAPTFHLGFCMRFLGLIWQELLLIMLWLILLGIGMVILTVITCYIGGLFAAPLMVYCWHHLQQQLYHSYLRKGGEAIEISPKLLDVPPVMPS
ncbi:MAG TPA: DUF4013 domain-containing protein [Luteolibacter sp.]|nr:DUF4013 domain-containing protein [Luteolibacter sp.]